MADNTRPYMARVFGQTFLVEAGNHANVRAHLVRRLRNEVEIRVADFEDGREAERLGIELEVAGAEHDVDPDAPEFPFAPPLGAG